MESIKEFKKAVQTVDIIVENHYFANQMGYVRAKDFPEFDFKGFDKKMLFAVNKSTDAEIRKLFTDAETSLILLSNDQLKKVVLLLQPYTYKSFYKKLGAFTVMFTKGKAHPMHITDFIYEMRNTFICDIPCNKGDLTQDFLHDLLEDITLKSGYVYAMIHRINKLLNEKKEEAPTDSTASTNKKIGLNEEEFKSYFKAQFKGMGNGNINHYSTLISEIGNTDFHKKEHGQIALMIYESGFLNDRKPKTFTKWYDIFCDFVGIERRTYEKNKLTNPSERIKKLFSYLS